MQLIENTLKATSYKMLKMYRSCPFSVYLKYIKRVPEPAPDPKYDDKRKRGIQAHDDLQATINDGAPVPKIAEPFAEIIADYINLGAVAEGDEYFNRQWQIIPHHAMQFNERGYPTGHWLVVKKDVRIRTPEFSIVVDWKTGKKHGNEIDHFEQMKLYAVTEWIIAPGLPEYVVELQYLDQKDTWSHTFKPQELERHWAAFDGDFAVMFNDRIFRTKPSILACRYCPFNLKNGTGACPVAKV